MAIAAGARKHGTSIYQNTEVSKMEMRSDGTWDVVTPKGTIQASRVVNCTGNLSVGTEKLIEFLLSLICLFTSSLFINTVY